MATHRQTPNRIISIQRNVSWRSTHSHTHTELRHHQIGLYTCTLPFLLFESATQPLTVCLCAQHANLLHQCTTSIASRSFIRSLVIGIAIISVRCRYSSYCSHCWRYRFNECKLCNNRRPIIKYHFIHWSPVEIRSRFLSTRASNRQRELTSDAQWCSMMPHDDGATTPALARVTTL